jgi:hypothetical protein
MKKRISALGMCILMLVFLGGIQGASADYLDLTLDTTGTTSHINFDSGPASTTAWHGDLVYSASTIGVFNAGYTSQGGVHLTQYDFVITGNGASIPEFASILVSNKPPAPTLLLNPDATLVGPGPIALRPTLIASGTVFAASAGLKSYVGAAADLYQPAIVGASPFFRITY